MKTLEVVLPDEIAAKIEQAAHERGVSIQDVLQSLLVENFERESDFVAAAAHVLEKNADLYRRLS